MVTISLGRIPGIGIKQPGGGSFWVLGHQQERRGVAYQPGSGAYVLMVYFEALATRR